MKNKNCDKLIIAVLQGDDYMETIDELNSHGFYVTILNSSGGFLKKKSVTIMIGLNHEYLDEALKLLKSHGERMEMRYQPTNMGEGMAMYPTSVQVPTRCGGVVLFVIDVEQNERF